jgi:5-formyltetrahydrofolate cyclo-ligase
MTAEKRSLRDEARARRAVVSRAVSDFAASAVRTVEALALPHGAIVAGYMAVRDEADPITVMKALEERGHPLALPCIEAPGRALIFRRWKIGDPLKANAFGIGEPYESSECVTPSVVLVPFLAFDREGHRLGYGGGYYDRTLAALKENGHVLAVGFGFAGQEVPALPRHSHDHGLDLVVTEQGIRRFR